MKKLFIILSFCFVAIAPTSCSKDEPAEPRQEFTSFVFIHNIENHTLPNCVAGYFDENGYCLKIADLGEMTTGKYTPEKIITDPKITEIYLFTDYFTPRVFRRSFTIKSNTKNVFELQEDDYANEVDKGDPTQYPH